MLPVVGVAAGAGIAGEALGLTGRRGHLLGEAMPRGGDMLPVVGVAAGAGVAGKTLGLAGGRDDFLGIPVGGLGEGQGHGLAALDADTLRISLCRAGGGDGDLPGGRRVGVLPFGFGLGCIPLPQAAEQQPTEGQTEQEQTRPFVFHDYLHRYVIYRSPWRVSNRTSAKILCSSLVGWLM